MNKKDRAILERLEKQTGIKIELPPETAQDRMLEAQSVLNYFTVNDGKWKTIKCATCGLMFSYRWNVDGIKQCSVECMAEALKKIGLEWNPGREPSKRWGQTVPAVLPPSVLEIAQQPPSATPKDPLDGIDPELFLL